MASNTLTRKCSKCKQTFPVDSHYYGRNTYCKPCHKEYSRAYNLVARRADPRLSMLYNARQRAKKEGLPCTLTLSDIVVPERCPVLGIPLKQNRGRIQDNSPTLDRIVPELGYVPSNVAVLSRRANWMKGYWKLSELEALTSWMRRHFHLPSRSPNATDPKE